MIKSFGKMKKCLWICITIFLYVCILFASIFAEDESIVHINNNMNEYELGTYIEMLEDSDRKLTIDDVTSGEYSSQFIRSNREKINFGLTDSAYWIKLTFENEEALEKNMFLEISTPYIDEIELFNENQHNIFEITKVGTKYPFYQRISTHRNFVLPVTFQPNQLKTIYLRLESDSFLEIKMKLWETYTFTQKDGIYLFLLGLYYGSMLIMVFYHLFLFISLRDKTFLHFAFFIFNLVLVQLVDEGLAYQFLWPYNIWLESRSLPFFIILSILSSILFMRSILWTAKYTPRIDKMLKALLSCLSVVAVVMLLINARISIRIALFFAPIAIVATIVPIIIYLTKVQKSIYYFLLVCFTFMVGSLLYLLEIFQILPHIFIARDMLKIGSVLGVLLISLRVGNRIKLMKNEKEKEEKEKLLLKTMHEITKKLTSTLNLDELLDLIVKSMLEIMHYKDAALILNDNGDFYMVAREGELGRNLVNKYLSAFVEDEYFSQVVKEKNVLVFKDVDFSPYGVSYKTSTCISIPILYHNRVLGLVALYSNTHEPPTNYEEEILFDLASQAGVAIENARLFSEIRNLAILDGLTGIYNRKHFFELAEREFQRAKLHQYSLSIIMIDIDRFKNINDQYGHLLGDKVLKLIVKKLKETIRKTDILGRYGGEEFVIALPQTNKEKAYKIAEKLRHTIETSKLITKKHGILSLTISLGVASISEETKEIGEIVGEADKALYEAKEQGRNLVC